MLRHALIIIETNKTFELHHFGCCYTARRIQQRKEQRIVQIPFRICERSLWLYRSRMVHVITHGNLYKIRRGLSLYTHRASFTCPYLISRYLIVIPINIIELLLLLLLLLVDFNFQMGIDYYYKYEFQWLIGLYVA